MNGKKIWHAAIVFLVGIFPFFHPCYGDISPPHQPIPLVWEGTYLRIDSLSNANREFAQQLFRLPEIKLTCVAVDGEKIGESLPMEVEKFVPSLSEHPPRDVACTVRHAWPPNWEAPARGKWVLMQPWEFGAIPEEWVENIEHIDEVWAATSYVKRQYVESGVPENKVAIIPYGIDPEKFHPQVPPFPIPTDKKFKFLFVGGAIYRKGCDLLLKSYLKSFTADDDVCLIIKGMGGKTYYSGFTLEEQIRQARKVPNGPEIIYWDEEMSHEEIGRIYTACDCLVSPYRGEGFSLPVLEAMASGLPVIVTKGGATDDFVTDAFGWFIPAQIRYIDQVEGAQKLAGRGWMLEPDVEALSVQMRWLVKHPERGRAKGLAASQHVRSNWTWEKAAKAIAVRLAILTDSSDRE